MHEEYPGQTISINAVKLRLLAFCEVEDTRHEKDEQDDDHRAAQEPPFFSHGAEDIICMLLRHEVALGLGAFGPAFAEPAATADGNLTLVGVVANPPVVNLLAQHNVEAVAVALLEDVIEDIAHRKRKSGGHQHHREIGDHARASSLLHEIRDHPYQQRGDGNVPGAEEQGEHEGEHPHETYCEIDPGEAFAIQGKEEG